MKTCHTCGVTLTPELAVRDRRRSDGMACECKPCKRVRSAARQHREDVKVRRAANYAHRRDDEHRRARVAENQRRYYQRVGWQERHALRDRFKESARKAVLYAIRTGKMVRPSTCESCRRACKPQAHHADYARKLDVQWLCTRCHGRQHRTLHVEVAA